MPPHSTPPSRRGSIWGRLEWLLFAVATVCLGYYGYVHAETFLYQRMEERELNTILSSRVSATPAAARGARASTAIGAAARAYPAHGSTLGRIEIPRLDVSAIVRHGSDARTLRLAVGHVAGTALPGERGNTGLAAHRDTFFKRLGDIRPGDAIVVTTPEGAFTYEVERTVIVEPTDVWVLAPTRHAALTLVTCYPFTYIGAAPRRFIVRATMPR